MTGRVWLDVAFAEKDLAKAAGARWDRDARRWYAPRPGIAALARWAPLPELLPGEDRAAGSGLFCDPIPSSSWFSNVRTAIDPSEWDRLRTMVYRRAGDRCEACGAGRDPEQQRWLEAHERWSYERWQPSGRLVQRLVRLVCLCTWCHEVTHWGRAQNTGRGEAALAHLQQVNRWTRAQALEHADAAMSKWARRSEHPWDLDLSMLTDAGITLAPPPAAAERPGLAAAGIRELHTPTAPRTPRAAPPTPRRTDEQDPPPRVNVRAVTVDDVAAGTDPLSRLLRGERP